jgi:hypothetical protein
MLFRHSSYKVYRSHRRHSKARGRDDMTVSEQSGRKRAIARLQPLLPAPFAWANKVNGNGAWPPIR